MEEIKLGRYRHFKGNEYEAPHLAKHSETLEPMVVYRALYGERGVLPQNKAALPSYFREDGLVRRHCSNEQFTVAEYVRANCEYPAEGR